MNEEEEEKEVVIVYPTLISFVSPVCVRIYVCALVSIDRNAIGRKSFHFLSR